MRNILYNKSDILIAVIIIVFAAIIIWSRVDAIMNTPGDNSAAGATTPGAVAANDVLEPDTPNQSAENGTTPPAVESDTNVGESVAPPPQEEQATTSTKAVKVTVANGSVWEIVAEDLEAKGLIESYDAFMSEMRAQGKEQKLKAGTFKIKPGTSLSAIVKKLSNP